MTLLLAGCKQESTTMFDPINPNVVDPRQGLTQKDYDDITKAALDPRISLKKSELDGPPIPDMAPILAAPQPPEIGKSKLVSITVTDDVPLKDVLIELARLADVDIEVDSGISGGVSFRAKDKPFNEVIERLSDLAGLRYNMDGGVLRVERDTPYIEIYPVDFINLERTSNSSVNISTNVLSGGGEGGLNTGSSSAISSTSASDFWSKFEEGIQNILSYEPSNLTAAASPAAGGGAAGTDTSGSNGFYNLNRQGATLTVSATERQHKLIRRFITHMETNASAQVIIEAKIVEITLNKDFETGIDWSQLGTTNINYVSTFGGISDPGNIATFSLTKQGLLGGPIDLDLAVRLSERFGTARTLSSPRLHAINNQQAVLTFAENQVYFQVTVDRETVATTAQSTTLTVNSEIKTVPIGIILMIQPSINMETAEVTMNVRPTLSRVTGFVSDPAVAFLIAQAAAEGEDIAIQSQVPVVEVRELDSILKLKSGQVMVIGGLMEDVTTTNDEQLPYVSTVPVVGNLFKGTDREHRTKELAIFIRATIVDSNGYASDADKAVYKKFIEDPRPLDF